MNDSIEPHPEWYARKSGIWGNIKVYFTFSFVYLCIALAPLIAYLLVDVEVIVFAKDHRITVALWAIFTTMAYPAWAWLEMQAFERWVRLKPSDQRIMERAYFKINNDLAKNFWTAVFAIYTAAAIVGIAVGKK